MNKMQAQVEEFHRAFNLPVGTGRSVQDIGFRLKLVQEELAEGYDAIYQANQGDIVPLIDLYCDLLYFIFGSAVAIGIDLEPFFDAIHKANMSKLVNGIAQYRADGKVAKPEGWTPADLFMVLKETSGTD